MFFLDGGSMFLEQQEPLGCVNLINNIDQIQDAQA
jgi:hypothetical protein